MADLVRGGRSSGGTFWRHKDRVAEDYDAVLIEPVKVEEGVPDKKFGGVRDLVHGDVTVFPKGGGEPEVLGRTSFSDQFLTRDLIPAVGQKVVVKPELTPEKGAHVWGDVGDDALKVVGAYVDERDAQLAKDAAEAPF